MYYITRKQLKDICMNNKYIVLRYGDNSTHSLNCKVALLSRFNDVLKDETETRYIGWYKCSFMKYISLKVPFI